MKLISHIDDVGPMEELTYIQMVVEADLAVILDDNEYVNVHDVHGFDDLGVLADDDDDDVNYDGDGVVVNVMDWIELEVELFEFVKYFQPLKLKAMLDAFAVDAG